MVVTLQAAICNGASTSAVETFRPARSADRIIRRVRSRDGEYVVSEIEATAGPDSVDLQSRFDFSWLRSTKRPPHPNDRGSVRVVDLFAGCGALSLGITEACRALRLGVEHVLAVDTNPLALATYARNFPGTRGISAPVESLVEPVGAKVSREESKLRREFGNIDILAAGPPCQGNSDLNNHTRRSDPKNALFYKSVRFAELLRPKHVIIENVPGVQHDKRGVTRITRRALEGLGYFVFECVLKATELGVPQKRRRYIMVATDRATFSFDSMPKASNERTLRWACGELAEVSRAHAIDSVASPSAENQRRIDYLFDHGLYDLPDSQRPPCHRLKQHSYRAVYGRLHWDEPAPTITSGFNSPGQGRFVHPTKRRTLTPHEAARSQFLPDWFDWGDAGREGLMQMIGNAVPPKLGYAVALELLR